MLGVSVIIPCYNAGPFLEEAVSSVVRSNPETPYEIIIVDDASDDPATQIVLKQISQQYDSVRIFCMLENGGQSKARNYALRVAKYDVILPLDADDKLINTTDGSYLDKVCKYLIEDPDIFAVTTDFRQFGRVSSLCKLYPFHEPTHLIKGLLPPFSAFRTSELMNANGYNEALRFAEDWDITVALMNRRRLERKPNIVAKAKGINALYRVHGSGKNASVVQRLPREVYFEKVIARSPEIYDHFYPGENARCLASKTRLIKTAFAMASRHPVEVLQFAAATALRRTHDCASSLLRRWSPI